jgi:hypothetical protein
MLVRNPWRRAVCAGALSLALLLVAGSALALTNELANPGFESGLTGWTAFGNAYAESSNPPQFVPYEGNGLVSMFGNFSGGFNVSGIFQEFPCSPGDRFQLKCQSRHWSGDAMTGQQGVGNSNWVVQKIAFFDAGSVEIGGAESTILDGTFATDVWHDNAAVTGLAPANSVKVQALILYLQPAFDGGAAHIDAVEFYDVTGEPLPAVTPWGLAAMSLLLAGGAVVVLGRRFGAAA